MTKMKTKKKSSANGEYLINAIWSENMEYTKRNVNRESKLCLNLLSLMFSTL